MYRYLTKSLANRKFFFTSLREYVKNTFVVDRISTNRFFGTAQINHFSVMLECNEYQSAFRSLLVIHLPTPTLRHLITIISGMKTGISPRVCEQFALGIRLACHEAGISPIRLLSSVHRLRCTSESTDTDYFDISCASIIYALNGLPDVSQRTISRIMDELRAAVHMGRLSKRGPWGVLTKLEQMQSVLSFLPRISIRLFRHATSQRGRGASGQDDQVSSSITDIEVVRSNALGQHVLNDTFFGRFQKMFEHGKLKGVSPFLAETLMSAYLTLHTQSSINKGTLKHYMTHTSDSSATTFPADDDDFQDGDA